MGRHRDDRRWQRSLSIIDHLYRRSARVPYARFRKYWTVGRPPADGPLSPPSQPTFSRIWRVYRRQNSLHSLRGSRLVDWLVVLFAEGKLDPTLQGDDLLETVAAVMARNGIVRLSDYLLRRAIATALRALRRRESEERFRHIAKALGVASLEALPLAQRWRAARELLRHPPAALGRANLIKMEREFQILREFTEVLAQNKLDLARILAQPDGEERFRFVERRPPSVLARWEQRTVLAALPFYIGGRLQESLDAVLVCFVRKARLLKERVQEESEEGRRAESLALLERTGPHLRALKLAVATALANGTPAPLRPFQGMLARLNAAGEAALDRHRLYQVISSRGGYMRKLARRLLGIDFVGRESHAQALVGVLSEVLRFAPFDRPIPRDVVKELHFLDVPPSMLARRQVFEPVVLTTLADYLSSGRVTVLWSRQFGDVGAIVPTALPNVNPHRWVDERRWRMDREWRVFEVEARSRSLVDRGHLSLHRPRSLLTPRELQLQRERHQELLRRLGTRPILEVVLRVHRATGLLDEFRLPRPARRQVAEVDRLRTAAGVLVASGMNVGITEMPSVLGRGYSVGRVQQFVDQYMTRENLLKALRRLLASWQDRRMGSRWGPGRLVSIDGKVVGSFEGNLLSRYHYRKGRSGMTVYWFRRDDGIATRVKPLGNQEWESWHAMDELLHPLVGELEESCGDTQGQFLALWGLAELAGKRILARFRRPSRVLLYKPAGPGRAGLEGLRVVDWDLIRRTLPCLMGLVEAIRSQKVSAVDVLRRWHLFDRHGHDLGAGLRELGKVSRTEFLLRYSRDEELQRRIQRACNDAENWNSFHEALFWGNGGKLRSNDPRRQEETLLALNLLMDAIVYYTVDEFGEELRRAKAPTPVVWEHIGILARYPFRRTWLRGVSRGDCE